MDQWPGYEANRQRLLKFFAAHGPLNPVVITGDIHSNWVNDLQVDERKSTSAIVATEFVCTSITSKGNGKPNEGTPAVMHENPFVRFYSDERGYVSCDVTPKAWTSRYRAVPESKYPAGRSSPAGHSSSSTANPGRNRRSHLFACCARIARAIPNAKRQRVGGHKLTAHFLADASRFV